MKIAIRAVAVVGALALVAAAAFGLPVRVASETAREGRAASFFTTGTRWHCDVSAVPAGRVPADDPARDMVFDDQAVVMAFEGLQAGARYEIGLTFLSDSGQRKERIVAGGAVLEDSLPLPNGTILRKRWAVPPDATRNGRLEVQARRLAGPNAIVSTVTVYAEQPGARRLTALPTRISAGFVWPRLSPRPSSVQGVKTAAISLNGAWQFQPAPAPEFWKRNNGEWKAIQVPGEWAMQGFRVQPGATAAYRTRFRVPADWSGRRVKLRFDAVYSDATVWVNGHEAGRHLGGFTPFELDVTELVRPGAPDTLDLAVRSDSLADTLASGMAYAAHDLGGIPRKVTLFALPPVNVADLWVRTRFDGQYRDATLKAAVRIANDSDHASPPCVVRLSLAGAGRYAAPASVIRVPAIPAHGAVTRDVSMAVASPRKWDCEHPDLYELSCSLGAGGGLGETVVRRVGFRQVDVRGNQVFVNGRPIKLHGVCRHETDPLRGRSLTSGMWRRDATLFRDMNANFIRTSHYPPAEEFIEACDELGLFMEEEAPFCWANGDRGQRAFDYTAHAELETVLRDRSHPSVIQWSIGNETQWQRNFQTVLQEVLRKADPTRPFVFDGGASPDVDIDAPHYPGLGAPAAYAAATRPTLFGEYGHLSCYNRREVYTDPGLRDLWGLGVSEMWERMRASQGVLGGSIWAGIDDLFYLPNGEAVGYGEWGPLDGWRRTRPEYWHLKQIYSPVRIALGRVPVPSAGQPIRVPVENRYLFSDLSEVRFEWRLGATAGRARISAAPGKVGDLTVPYAPGRVLEARAYSPRGFLVDAWRIAVGEPDPAPAWVDSGRAALTLHEGSTSIESGSAVFTIDTRTGSLSAAVGGRQVLVGGPHLMLLPLSGEGFSQLDGKQAPASALTDPCAGWKVSGVTTGEEGGAVDVRIAGEYQDAVGEYRLRFAGDGHVTVDYRFRMKATATPRQIGIVFDTPLALDTLSWRRNAQWTVYPEDHVGRPAGTARAFPGTPILLGGSPRSRPTWPWRDDCTPMGSNDFRATRANILEAGLTSKDGAGLRIISDGRQHERAWVEDGAVHLLIADLTNEGCPACFNEFAMPRPTLKPGDVVTGRVRMVVHR